MNLNCTPFLLRLVFMLAAILAMPSSVSASSNALRAPTDTIILEENHSSGRSIMFDHGSHARSRRVTSMYVSSPTSVTPMPQLEATPTPPEQNDVSVLQLSAESGDVIHRRLFTIMAAAAVSTACLLLLLWAYVSLRDPFLRRRASMRVRRLRREERRSRLRRQGEQ